MRVCYLFTVEAGISLLLPSHDTSRALSTLPATKQALGTGPIVSGVVELGTDSRRRVSCALRRAGPVTVVT